MSYLSPSFPKLVETSYRAEDVVILLQDVRGKVPMLGTEEREKLNQSGIHYSEMLPIEYVPTDDYMRIYEGSLEELSLATANAVALLSKKIVSKLGADGVIVSLARAGTPVGILVKRYIKLKWGYDYPHYSISIIRGKGIDVEAMRLIISRHPAKNIQFLDGWVGKGAINTVLADAVEELKNKDEAYVTLSPDLAVLSDPASATETYGTRQDFLIPSACLNATVSGLVSRTVKLSTMGDNELHGAVYYSEQERHDLSYEFIDAVENNFDKVEEGYFKPSQAEADETFKGIDEVKAIGAKYGIDDINKIKPGVGETTRVLLRRVPWKVLISPNADERYVKHIKQLCKEKGIPLEEYPFKKYNVCGLIKTVADL